MSNSMRAPVEHPERFNTFASIGVIGFKAKRIPSITSYCLFCPAVACSIALQVVLKAGEAVQAAADPGVMGTCSLRRWAGFCEINVSAIQWYMEDK